MGWFLPCKFIRIMSQSVSDLHESFYLMSAVVLSGNLLIVKSELTQG